MTSLEIYSDEFIKSQATYFGRLAARTPGFDHNYVDICRVARMYREERRRRFEAAVARHEIPRMVAVQWRIDGRPPCDPMPSWIRKTRNLTMGK